MLSMALSHQLQYPIYDFLIAATVPTNSGLSGLKVPLPCDLHLVNFKMLQDNIKSAPSDTSALFFHRIGYDCAFKNVCSTSGVSFLFYFILLTDIFYVVLLTDMFYIVLLTDIFW